MNNRRQPDPGAPPGHLRSCMRSSSETLVIAGIIGFAYSASFGSPGDVDERAQHPRRQRLATTSSTSSPGRSACCCSALRAVRARARRGLPRRGALGFIISDGESILGFIPINTEDNVLHLVVSWPGSPPAWQRSGRSPPRGAAVPPPLTEPHARRLGGGHAHRCSTVARADAAVRCAGARHRPLRAWGDAPAQGIRRSGAGGRPRRHRRARREGTAPRPPQSGLRHVLHAPPVPCVVGTDGVGLLPDGRRVFFDVTVAPASATNGRTGARAGRRAARRRRGSRRRRGGGARQHGSRGLSGARLARRAAGRRDRTGARRCPAPSAASPCRSPTANPARRRGGAR